MNFDTYFEKYPTNNSIWVKVHVNTEHYLSVTSELPEINRRILVITGSGRIINTICETELIRIHVFGNGVLHIGNTLITRITYYK